ncbi:hypothetical protein SAMN05880582_1011713 [Rhizobium sp. RU20A]|uniref:outer membrane lipoprotein Omp10 n=1 Tax=Rhizobium sp. RU20A TaxID=1907412 RepID=UPI000953D6B3|nr:outer membrane lipoprotein Omp10 [Rhizobium sp. RU20A]SIQ39427.1 hypothetical protein SAMN05880582_1011713 [Rhizobium sp. RU20A]
MHIRTPLILAAIAATLSACQSEPRESYRPMPVAQQRIGVDGAWSDPNGIVSTFTAGTFSTRTTDTNQLLATGTYINVTDKLVEISMTSLVRNTQQKVNCALVTPSQLNCTTDKGAQFSLQRRA